MFQSFFAIVFAFPLIGLLVYWFKLYNADRLFKKNGSKDIVFEGVFSHTENAVSFSGVTAVKVYLKGYCFDCAEKLATFNTEDVDELNSNCSHSFPKRYESIFQDLKKGQRVRIVQKSSVFGYITEVTVQESKKTWPDSYELLDRLKAHRKGFASYAEYRAKIEAELLEAHHKELASAGVPKEYFQYVKMVPDFVRALNFINKRDGCEPQGNEVVFYAEKVSGLSSCLGRRSRIIYAIEGGFESVQAEEHFKRCKKCQRVLEADKAEFLKDKLITA